MDITPFPFRWSFSPLVKISLGMMFLGPVAKMTATDYGPEMFWWVSPPIPPSGLTGQRVEWVFSPLLHRWNLEHYVKVVLLSVAPFQKKHFIFNLLSKIQLGYFSLSLESLSTVFPLINNLQSHLRFCLQCGTWVLRHRWNKSPPGTVWVCSWVVGESN